MAGGGVDCWAEGGGEGEEGCGLWLLLRCEAQGGAGHCSWGGCGTIQMSSALWTVDCSVPVGLLETCVTKIEA